MKKTRIFAILILIILIGGALRFYKIGANSFYKDEFFELNASYGYFKAGKWLAWDFNNNQPLGNEFQEGKEWSNQRAQSYRIQLATLYRFAEPTEANTRAISAIWGVLSIIIVYFITLSFTGNVYVALLAAFLTAVGESEILFTRRLRMYAMLFPIYLIFSWTVYKLYESHYRGKFSFFRKIYQKLEINPAYLLPAAVAGLVSYEIHELATSIIVALTAYCAIFAVKSLFKGKIINKYSLTLLAAFIAYLIANVFFNDAIRLLKESVSFLNRRDYDYVKFYFTDFRYLPAGAALMVLGFWFLARKLGKAREAIFIAASAFAPLAFAVSSWTREPAHRYVYFIQSFGIILAAAGVFSLISFFSNKFPKYKKALAVVIIILFLAALDFSYIYGKENFYKKMENATHVDFRQLFSYVKENRQPQDVMITRAYRSYYFPGEKIPVYDIKGMDFEKGNCRQLFQKIISENKSGWIILPEIDNLSVCKDGKQYLYNELKGLKSKEIPDRVFVYRWGN
ncbi:MAG: hypothetical protein NT136_03835 [Candidatus Moranbacteria bacterium]|nr:hypothetical protein [Candidatus Moranbacteria bacterium]